MVERSPALAAQMVVDEDHPVLLELEEKYGGVFFYDADDGTGASRIVREIEWNKKHDLWEARTERVNDDGSELARGKQKRSDCYGLLGEDGDREKWMPVFDEMVEAFKARKARAAAEKKRKKSRRE